MKRASFILISILILFYSVSAVSADLKEVVSAFDASNSVLVAGEIAQPMDWIGAAKVASTFSAVAKIAEEASTSVIGSQDSYILNAHLEDSVSNGRAMGSGYLSILNEGKLQGRNNVKTKQYITISEDAEVQYMKSDEDKVGDHLVFDSDKAAYTYRMDFTPRANSDREVNSGVDFEGSTLSILGKEYRITDIDVTGAGLEIRMLAGDVRDTIYEGDTKTYTINEETLTVTVNVIASGGTKAKITVNDKEMDVVKQDYVYRIPGTSDLYIAIGEILENEAGEVDAGRDMLEFYLGANLVQLTDDDISDGDFNSDGLMYNSERIDDSYVKIVGEITATDIYLSSLFVEWWPDSELEIPLGESLSDYTEMGQIFGSTPNSNAFDLVFDNEVSVDEEEIEFRSESNTKYKLRFGTSRGDYSITAYEMDGAALVTKVISDEGATATVGDMIVFSKSKETAVAKITQITADAAGNGDIKLNDLGDGSHTYSLVNHVASVTFHGNTYTLTEQNNGAQVVLTDLNGDGGTSGYTSIWTKYGAEIRVGKDSNGNSIDGITFLENEDGKEESSNRGSTEVKVKEINNVIYAQTPTFSDATTISFNSYGSRDYARTLWGTKVVVDDLDNQRDVKFTARIGT